MSPTTAPRGPRRTPADKMPSQQPKSSPPRSHSRRLAWLLACFFTGLLIGILGSSLSGNTIWYVAIPAVIAAGWLFLADPTECERPPRQGTNGDADERNAR